MNILVCVKISNGALSPFDECALEAALQLNGNATVLSMGAASAREPLLKLTRLGVNRAILLNDPAFAGADTLATAYALSKAAKKINPDLILCGRQSLDGDTAQTGPSLAAMLNIPVITGALDLNVSPEKVHCETRTGKKSADLPALVTVERFLKLRFPRLGSKVGTVEILSADDIGADRSKCGLRGSPTRVIEASECSAGRRFCKFIDKNELTELIENAINIIPQNENAPVKNNLGNINVPLSAARPRGIMSHETPQGTGDITRICVPPSAWTEPAARRLKSIWCVGAGAAEMAKAVADEIVIIQPDSPQKLAEKIRAEAPRAVLWEASPLGRELAPQTAAILQTGLCADCTSLETDGESLFMIRPAKGGSVIAKIRCETLPQMATVRCAESDSAKVIVGLGLGAAENISKWILFAESRGYEWAASRALVDKRLAPYEKQIGLTGRTISPKVYLAVGISGAIQHTCAIESAGTVIAINPDSKARIFDYADFGIIESAENIF